VTGRFCVDEANVGLDIVKPKASSRRPRKGMKRARVRA